VAEKQVLSEQEIIEECVKRMKLLKIHENVIQEFQTGEHINLSERNGILYWLNDDEEKHVKDFEKEYHVKVYHVIKNFFEFGVCYSYLYTSGVKEEWPEDRKDLRSGYAWAYVYNETEPDFSEFGTIGIRSSIGGIARTA